MQLVFAPAVLPDAAVEVVPDAVVEQRDGLLRVLDVLPLCSFAFAAESVWQVLSVFLDRDLSGSKQADYAPAHRCVLNAHAMLAVAQTRHCAQLGLLDREHCDRLQVAD